MKNKSELEALVRSNRREMKEIYRGATLPVVGLTSLGEDDKPVIDHKIDLKDYENAIEALPAGSVFTLGRAADNDLRPGLQRLKELFLEEENGSAEEIAAKAEMFYYGTYRTISRYHAAVERTSEGEYVVYDCSLAGTVIVPDKKPQGEPRPAEPQIKRLPWWKKFLPW